MKAFPLLSIRLAVAFLLSLPLAAPGQSVEGKAWAIQLPQLELRDATVEESIRMLANKSRELDPSHQGVNIVCMAPIPAETRLNLRLINVPLREAVRYVARLSGMRLTAGPNALLLAPGGGDSGPTGFKASPAAQAASGIILPQVEFRDSTLPEALDFLVARSRALDPKKQGVNVVLDVPPEKRDARITLSLRSVPLAEALRYAAQLAGLDVTNEPYALVVVVPKPKRAQTADAAPAGGGN